MDENLKILIQQEIDGANSPEDSARLQSILESDKNAREFYLQLIKLSSGLSHLKFSGHISDSIAKNVMSEISKSKPSGLKPVQKLSNKKWIGIVAAAAVLLIVALFAYNVPQPEISDVKGTIGVNDENEKETVSEKIDKPEIEQLQHSDSFGTLITSKNFQHVSANDKLTELITSQEFLTLKSDPDFIRFTSKGANTELIENFETTKIPTDSEYTVLFSGKAFQTLISDYNLAEAMAHSQFRSIVQNEDFTELLSNPTFVELLRSGKIHNWMNDRNEL